MTGRTKRPKLADIRADLRCFRWRFSASGWALICIARFICKLVCVLLLLKLLWLLVQAIPPTSHEKPQQRRPKLNGRNKQRLKFGTEGRPVLPQLELRHFLRRWNSVPCVLQGVCEHPCLHVCLLLKAPLTPEHLVLYGQTLWQRLQQFWSLV